MLGEEADWDMLVYQFVTKSEENHERLTSGRGGEIPLDTEVSGPFGCGRVRSRGPASVRLRVGPVRWAPSCPAWHEARSFDEFIEAPEEDIDLSQAGGYPGIDQVGVQ